MFLCNHWAWYIRLNETGYFFYKITTKYVIIKPIWVDILIDVLYVLMKLLEGKCIY